MMKTLVVYYSRDGSTREVATALARDLLADIEELDAVPRYVGFLGYFRAGYDSWKGYLPAIGPVRYSPGEYDLVVIGGPLWAGHLATPIRAYLKSHQGEFSRIAAFITYGGSSPAQAIKEVAQLSGRVPDAEMAVRTKDVAEGTFMQNVSEFVGKLR